MYWKYRGFYNPLLPFRLCIQLNEIMADNSNALY